MLIYVKFHVFFCDNMKIMFKYQTIRVMLLYVFQDATFFNIFQHEFKVNTELC